MIRDPFHEYAASLERRAAAFEAAHDVSRAANLRRRASRLRCIADGEPPPPVRVMLVNA